MTAVWRCEPRSHGRSKASIPLPGWWPSSAVPHRRRLRRCVLLSTQHLFFLPPGAYLCRWLVVFRARGVLVSVVGRPVCKPPERGGTGARVQGCSRRPRAGRSSRAGARAGWLVRVRCTSGRSASAACGVRGVRAAQ